MTSLRKKIIAIGGALAYPSISLTPDITREHFCRKWILVTGASHGIGRALTEKLISAGANIFLIARSEADLRLLCAKAKQMGSSADYCAIDLRDREKLEQLCQKLRETLPRLDYFFCNAGKSIHRKINEAQDRLHDYDRTMDLNYRSLVALSLAILPALKASKGHIIYSSSVSTLYPWHRAGQLIMLQKVRQCMVRDGRQRVCAIRCSCADSLFTLGSHSDVRCQRTIQALTSLWSI